MKVGRDYVWWVSYSWTYEWLEAQRFYCNKKDIKKEAEKKAAESMNDLKYRNLKVTINDCYKTTIEEI